MKDEQTSPQLQRRTRNHGSCEPRRRGLRRDLGGLQHHLAARAAAEFLVDSGVELPIPLLRHAKDAPGMRANALVVFPGGFGTIDELFEILALRQTDNAPRIPIVLVDREYWRSVINFDRLVDLGMVDAADLDLFGFADDAEGIWVELLARGLKPHSSIELAPEQDRP
jgi:hypothetical protein